LFLGSYNLKIKYTSMKFLKVKEVKSPNRGTPQSAGIDLFVPESFTAVVLEPGESVLIPSGLKVNVPEGFALICENKSGIATKKSLIVGACIIDEDYQGEIHIHLINAGTQDQSIFPGDKIIQVLLVPVAYAEVEIVSTEDELWEGKITERGEGGFGSTGTK
jgi:dUTP pyrophosphatase